MKSLNEVRFAKRSIRPTIFVICGLAVSVSLLLILAARQLDARQSARGLETAQAGRSAGTTLQQLGRTKLAEGEYAIYEEGNGGAVGPTGEEVYDFHEFWTLWREGKDGYEVDGVRQFVSPREIHHADRFLVELSRDMTLTHITEFTKLAWRHDPGPINCEFQANEVHCFTGAWVNGSSSDLRIQMQYPYGFLWPISPFSLSSLTRQTERDPDHPSLVQLLSIEQPTQVNAIYPVVLSGKLQFLGDENIEAAELSWHAHKYSLKVATHPQVLLWTSENGLLLSVAVEHAHPNWPQEGMKLVKYQKCGDF